MNTEKQPELGDVFWMFLDDGIEQATIITIHGEQFNPEFGLLFNVEGDVNDDECQIMWNELHNAWHVVGIELDDWDIDSEWNPREE